MEFDDADEKPQFSFPPCGNKTPYVLFAENTTESYEVPATINRYLRDYQRDGVRFLFEHYVKRTGAILGDDMGLGKTVQVIAFLSAIMRKSGTGKDKWFLKSQCVQQYLNKQRRIVKPFLIISPASVMFNWIEELETWAYFAVGKFYGSSLEETTRKVKNGKLEVVVTTFETARNHLELLQSIAWDGVIVDECHKIKEPKAGVTQALKKLKCLQRYGLTGTAFQNNMKELWCILDWANPKCLGTWGEFENDYVKVIEQGQLYSATKREVAEARKKKEEFGRLRNTYMLRRTKDLIANQLPEKEDHVVYCQLSALQLSVYQSILESDHVKLILQQGAPCTCGSRRPRNKCCYKKNQKCNVRGLMLAYISLLQKVANHVALLLSPTPVQDSRMLTTQTIKEMAFSKNPEFVALNQKAAFKTLSDPKFCGKLQVMVKLLKIFESQRAKVLVFSYSTKLLDIVEQYVIATGYDYRRIDGKVKSEQRLQFVQEFNKNPHIFLLLLSTKACGLGLNITSANIVIIFDPNWNPTHDLQAQDRAYRIGQRNNVQVYRLISVGTIEETIYLRQIYKQQLGHVALATENARRYFDALQGHRDYKGEIFGIRNLFAIRTGKSILTETIFKRSDVIESKIGGISLGKYRLKDAPDVKEQRAEPRTKQSFDSEEDEEEEEETVGSITEPDMANEDMKNKSIRNIFEECGIAHLHSNRLVVGSSKVEDHITRCAIKDVFENNCNSQLPAVDCDPYLPPINDKKDSIGGPHDSSMVELTDAMLIYGRTPHAVRRGHFDAIADHMNISPSDLAQTVVASSRSDISHLLHTFYSSRHASLDTEIFNQ